jgi:hypothetical protein
MTDQQIVEGALEAYMCEDWDSYGYWRDVVLELTTTRQKRVYRMAFTAIDAHGECLGGGWEELRAVGRRAVARMRQARRRWHCRQDLLLSCHAGATE